MMRQLLLATRNQHKVHELQQMLAGLDIKVQTLDEFPNIGEVEEDQDTLEGNARKKAREVFRHANIPTLADDSGLEVFYLNDAPGVFSSRYAGPTASYSDNCRKLLGALRGVPPRRRSAQFRCVLSFVAPGVDSTAEGSIQGVITEKPRGASGFGYDPLFIPSGHNETFAEMSSGLKNTLSHRAKALEAMRPILVEYFNRVGKR